MFKKWIVVISFLLPFWVVQVDAQSRGSSAAPASLQSIFDDHFPGASEVLWKKGPEGYTVSFKEKNLRMTAQYDLSETWEYTDIILPRGSRGSVPKALLNHFEQKYGSSPILSMGYHDSPAESYFRVEAEINQKKHVLKYDSKGGFISIR